MKLKFTHPTIPTSEVKITKAFSQHMPRFEKLKSCVDFYRKNDYFDRQIIVDADGYLHDGYCAYLVAVLAGVAEVKVLMVAEKAVRSNPVTEPVKENSPKPHMFSVGNKVVCLGKHHEEDPGFYPESETTGEIINTNFDFEKPYFVKWAEGSTSGNCEWWAYADDLKPYVETIKSKSEPVKNEPVKLYCTKSFSPGEWLTKGKIYDATPDFLPTYDDGFCPRGGYDSIEEFHKGNPDTGASLFPLVRRPAKVGEWIYPLEDCPFGRYKKGELLKCTIDDKNVTDVWRRKAVEYNNSRCVIKHDEYLVLSGYTGDPA